jgi:hypothetical protein
MRRAEKVIAQWKKNASEVIRVSISRYGGRKVFSIRLWYRPGGDGDLRPGRRGINLDVIHLKRIVKALRRARRGSAG